MNGVLEFLRKHLFQLLIIVLFSMILVVSVKVLLSNAKSFSDELVASDMQQLQTIFKRIDDSCKILGFDHQENFVDFLTVQMFVSSEVGSMNLAYPDKWEGPYVDDNPTVQGEVYRIIKTRKGYYLVPGRNVQLSNGIVLDRDLIFDEQADIDAMIADQNKLMFRGKPLAVKISVQGSKDGRKHEVHLPLAA
ncbi:hypothetical protein JW872_00270 [Candidatus Babeliales bacterium]|nr:hypothetical protein [Candidatus Babeliales bacterium]